MKKFYKEVSLGEEQGVWRVLLDGKPIRTPSKKMLDVPFKALAEAVAQEWREQGETIEMAQMVLTRLAYGVVELTDADRAMLREETEAYITTELLCYLDGEQPELLAQQQRDWGALLVWAQEALGMVLHTTTGIMPVAQPEASTAQAKALVGQLSDWQLVPFALITRILGSLVLAFAVLRKYVDVEEALRLSRLEQAFQYAKWGEDVAMVQRHRIAAREAEAAARFMFFV